MAIVFIYYLPTSHNITKQTLNFYKNVFLYTCVFFTHCPAFPSSLRDSGKVIHLIVTVTKVGIAK